MTRAPPDARRAGFPRPKAGETEKVGNDFVTTSSSVRRRDSSRSYETPYPLHLLDTLPPMLEGLRAQQSLEITAVCGVQNEIYETSAGFAR